MQIYFHNCNQILKKARVNQIKFFYNVDLKNAKADCYQCNEILFKVSSSRTRLTAKCLHDLGPVRQVNEGIMYQSDNDQWEAR